MNRNVVVTFCSVQYWEEEQTVTGKTEFTFLRCHFDNLHKV